MQAIMETLFDAVYLVSVITIGILMIRGSKGNRQFRLFGFMAVVLGAGDAFHLIPRAVALCTTGLENYTVPLGLGKWITSVTMTIFYVLLYYVWRQRYHVKGQGGLTTAVYVLAGLRILLCMMPQNQWLSADAPPLLGHLPQHSLRSAWSAGDRAVLSQCQRSRGPGVSVDVADHCIELWLLHPGGTLGRCHPHDWDADDPQNLRLCLDSTYRVFRHETGVPITFRIFHLTRRFSLFSRDPTIFQPLALRVVFYFPPGYPGKSCRRPSQTPVTLSRLEKAELSSMGFTEDESFQILLYLADPVRFPTCPRISRSRIPYNRPSIIRYTLPGWPPAFLKTLDKSKSLRYT